VAKLGNCISIDQIKVKIGKKKSIVSSGENGRSFVTLIKSGASNLRPRHIFVRPKLDSEFKEKLVFLPIFLRFLIDCGPKYEKKADLRPKDQLGLDAPELNFTWNQFGILFSNQCTASIFYDFSAKIQLRSSKSYQESNSNIHFK
jgi:hypothetical protein